MQVLSHRGYWLEPQERNQPIAFDRSFALGFGTETDVRDRDGELVISHDPAGAEAMRFSDYLALVGRHQRPGLAQALNIKADGLAQRLAQAMKGFAHPWFVFDMSLPDTLQQLKAGNPVYARMSEYEPFAQRLAGRIQGIWLDGFESTWYGGETVSQLLDQGLKVCVVSPELHQRTDAPALWAALKPLAGREGLSLCTDLPEEASQALGLQS